MKIIETATFDFLALQSLLMLRHFHRTAQVSPVIKSLVSIHSGPTNFNLSRARLLAASDVYLISGPIL